MHEKFRAAPVRYTSFDWSTVAATKHRCPDRYGYWDTDFGDSPRIARGAGLSYAPASFAAQAVTTELRSFNRALSFDPSLPTIEVEAGMNLGELYNILAPRNLYLPVQPGHPAISVGGCVAADVHGKNQFRDGTFMAQVKSLRLFHPRHGVLEIDRNREAALFKLTCGGYGLTGDIISVVLTPRRAPSHKVFVQVTPLKDIFGLPELLMQSADRADLVYSWHDFTAKGRDFGAGFVREGRFSTDAVDDKPLGQAGVMGTLDAATRGNWRFSFFNRGTTRPFNWLFHRASLLSAANQVIDFRSLAFPVESKTSYFRLFGRKGFCEYQFVVPVAAFSQTIDQIKVRLARYPVAVTLASAKLFRGDRELLRFRGDGICLALNFPRNADAAPFASFLDGLLIESKGLPNIIKDSRLSATTVERTYEGYEAFRSGRRQFDPKHLYTSELAKRLHL